MTQCVACHAGTNRQHSRLKLLIRDATGVWLCQRRLHLPLYRLEQISTRQNVTLARSTLSEWIGRSSNDLDDGPPIVVFDYQSSRSGKHPAAFLEGWHGTLMVDDDSGTKPCLPQDLPGKPAGHTPAGNSLIWTKARHRDIPSQQELAELFALAD